MRRWAAVLLLCLIGLYLGAAGVDRCAGTPDDACAPVCHILCSDGCATAPVPEPPVPPAPDPLPRVSHDPAPAAMPSARTVEPEKTPPRS
jgi:hypothetical protein